MVRKAAGSFPVEPLAPTKPPRAVLTQWLSTGDLPKELTIGQDCMLVEPVAKGAKWRGSNVDMSSEEVQEHLKAGMQVSQLGLEYEDRMSFVLDENLVVRKLKFLDAALDTLEGSESDANEQDATFMLMALEVAQLLKCLERWFGVDRPE